METYTEQRMIVKYRNKKTARHTGNVHDYKQWVQGHGLRFMLGDTFGGGVESISIYEYTGTVGLPAKRGQLLLYVKGNDNDQTDLPVR